MPKAVKRVHEIYEKPTFMENVDGSDIRQGNLGDCWLLAAMTALANVEGGVKRTCVAYDTSKSCPPINYPRQFIDVASEIGIYGFVFYRDGEWIYSIIDDKLYLKASCWDSPSTQRDLLQQIDKENVESIYRKTYQTGSKALFFGKCKDENETWVPLMEKAFAKAHGDYASLSGGWIGEGLEDLSGGVTNELLTSDILDIDEFWDNEMSKVNEEFLFGCSTGLMEYGYGSRDGIREAHAYVVVDARKISTGQRLVKLRNPWGLIRKGIWEGPWSDGSKEWTTEVQEELGHKFGNDSVFWIAYEDLLRKYTHFDRTRLFKDKDWRSCQRWVGVDVPWKPEYHEKFHIKLTQDSPLVLVLSQIDDRYFKGLQGQYKFRLHFRLHQQDGPGAEDYIVRSHGNYLMNRSVSVELPDMPEGNYIVYLKVTGERSTSKKSVEDVVKRECKDREENQKLAQVGYAFDLAHSKAWDHIDKVNKQRNKRDQAKASSCRQDVRRRNWEKRHLTREATKAQTRKNKDKKQRRRDAWDEEQRKLDEQWREEQEEKARIVAENAKAADEKRVAEHKAALAASGNSQEQASNDETKTEAKDESKAEAEETEKDETKSNDGSRTSDSSGSPQDTPRTEDSHVVPSVDARQEVPPVSGPPPPPPPPVVELPVRPRPAYDSAGDSSDSPVDDYEALYSDDDLIRKPRVGQPPAPQPKIEYDTEEEKMPTPWNAVSIVGIRVYSKDANLELRTVMEGGELLEDGMGERGAADLDDAQANAGGVRAGDKDGSAAGSNTVPYPPVVRREGDEVEDLSPTGARNSTIDEYFRIGSADTTPEITPGPTPMEGDR